MSARAHFRVTGRLDSAGPLVPGKVTIDRRAGLFTVRPMRRRRTYELPLSTVAEMVVARIIRAEVFAKRLAKKKGKP